MPRQFIAIPGKRNAVASVKGERMTSEVLSPLKEARQKYQADHPHVRIRDAAAALGVSEAELLATGIGDTVVRLAAPAEKPGWGKVIERLPALGRVMALSRNEHCVHERKGLYREIGFFGFMGNVVGPDIDLRFFLDHWHFGFAVREPEKDGDTKRSLQFFDRDGSAVHKVYLQPESDVAAFDAIAADFSDPAQDDALVVQPAAGPLLPGKLDGEVDAGSFRAGWEALQDTHEFFGLLKKFGVERTQALRLAGEEFARTVAPASVEKLLRDAAARAVPIMVFVGNPGMIQIHTGPVERIVPFGKDGEWINVLDQDFNLHLRQTAITQAWVVKKPTRDGFVTSAEFYDATGELIVQFFGKRKPGEPELESWRDLAAGLA